MRPVDEDCWQAVKARSRTADGQFVFAVTTTGIYCRPSCPARRPRRQNARFFASPVEAEAVGFRACKRCHPASASDRDPHTARITAIARACRTIENAEARANLADLARAAGMSPSHFHRTFKATVGLTPADYAEAVCTQAMRDGLKAAPTVTAAFYDAGYNSGNRFYAAAEGILGMKPQTFRKGGAGEHIRHVVLPSSLGQVLVAATDKGVCNVTLGDDPDALEADLARRFPAAEQRKADKAFSMLAATVFDTIDGEPGRSMELPLDLRGTAFQMRVWQALRRIPSGTTTSYGDLAQAIGAPRAVRAVAQACGANPVAIIVPCHRVIGKDGAITGYRWGIERKKALLDRESRGSPTSRTTPAKKPRARKARNA